LSEKKHVTKLLLQCGATIDEFNCVRKHLSMIKGGKLVQNMNCDGCALIMSDVVSNDLSVISSGCTYNDNTTFSDAIKIITKYSLGKKLPKKVITHLKRGLNTKTRQPNRLTIKNKIIANEPTANFFLMNFDKTKINSDEAFEKLANKRLILRKMEQYKIPNSLRLTVGNKQANEHFVQAIGSILK